MAAYLAVHGRVALGAQELLALLTRKRQHTLLALLTLASRRRLEHNGGARCQGGECWIRLVAFVNDRLCLGLHFIQLLEALLAPDLGTINDVQRNKVQLQL